MPTRIIREGILTSEKVNALSIGAELFFRRLMSVADDYGRYFAHPSILRANCFPLKLDQVSEANVKQWLSECEANGLIVSYDSGKHLQITNFQQQTRSKSKFPEPDKHLLSSCKANEKQMSSLVGDEVVVEGEVETNQESANFDYFWSLYPNKVGKPKAKQSYLKAVRSHSFEIILAGLKRHLTCNQWTKDNGQFIPHPTTWLNQERFNDTPMVSAAAQVVEKPLTKKIGQFIFSHDKPPTREQCGDDWEIYMADWENWKKTL